MKKFLIATGVAVLAFASVAAAQSYMFNTNLTVGSTGADVVALQSALISAGHSIPSIASGAAAKGYFGSQTKTAVMAYQASKGIPNTGFVGPLTRAALNGSTASTGGSTVVMCPVGYNCTPVGGSTSTGGSTTLVGTDGTISDVTELSQYSNEEVGDGQSDVKVLGFEVESSIEGDVALKSVKVSFDSTGNGGSDNLDDYIDSVSVWMGSTEVGSADVSGFNEDAGVYTKTITLSNSVVKADKTVKFYVAVDAVNNLDSGDTSSDSWTVDVDSIRYEDGSGVTTTEDAYDLGSMDVAVDFVGFSAAADTELKISTDSANNPDAAIVMVDDENDTDNVLLLAGKLRLDGSSDVTIDSLPVTLTGTASTSLAAITGSITLKIDGEEYTETVSATTTNVASITFDNLNFDMSAGSTVLFTISADINDINPTAASSTDMNEGYALKADVTASNRNVIDAENEEGDQLADSSEKSGTANGNYMEFRTEGIGLTFISATAVSNNSDSADTGTFTIKFKVTAFGDTVYVATLAANAITASVYDSAGLATTSNAIAKTIKNETDSTKTSVGNFEIEEGESETFTVTVTASNGVGDASDQYYAALTGFKWDLVDDTTPANTYSSELDEFQTPTVFLDNN